MSQAATRDDITRLGDAITQMAEQSRAAADTQTALLREFVESARHRQGPVQTVSLPAAQSAKPERLAWAMFAMVAVMSTVTGGAVVASVLQGQRISDLRADMLAERHSREAFEAWADQESKAVRSYIINGRLQPMQPRPQPAKTEP